MLPRMPVINVDGELNEADPPSNDLKSKAELADELRRDSRLGEVESHRVFCKLCQQWVMLHETKEYYSYTWLKHAEECEQQKNRCAAFLIVVQRKTDMDHF